MARVVLRGLLLSAVLGVAVPAVSLGVVVYDNTTTPTNGAFGPGTSVEIGDQITLAGTERRVTSFECRLVLTYTPDGDEQVRVRFYANDGPIDGGVGQPEPQSLLYDSGFFPLTVSVGQETISLNDLSVTVPDTFTWALEFSGIDQTSETSAILLYDPPTVGSSENFLWLRDALGGWAPAGASPVFPRNGYTLVNAAGPLPELTFHGEHRIEYGNLGFVSATGTGVAIVNGSGGHLGRLQLGTNFATIDGAIDITDPLVTAGGVVEILFESVRSDPGAQGGVFAQLSGALQNTAIQLTQKTMPMAGFVRICLFVPGCGGASLNLDLSQTVNGTRIGMGVGGTIAIENDPRGFFSIVGAPWTVKTATASNRTDNGGITFFTQAGFAHGPASLTSSTAVTSGVIQLVSPSQQKTLITRRCRFAPARECPLEWGTISQITLHFVPEPGILLLVGTGAAGLALIGRSRIRR